ncbi:hypothetical protein SAMN04515661_13021 [Candidatus Frackibacter sp. WG11]|uniref:efflux RND transporter permease subunit n=1 Tax=Candidatus Frackibacter sp. WG11 TaxID=2017976 RepID=UPI00088DAB73|nr:efflux RND transporter permease subunit [Candidatus Frackibacter sp. WG11]SDC84887.1 hypothetical protein SAMN04515661_13021 [Candidatus Frackibacter sp. WG11]
MNFKEKVTNLSVNHPRAVVIFFIILTILLATQIPKIQIDTDPENMLSEDEFVRQFHDQTKKDFELYDMVVLGVVNEDSTNGVFNPKTLKNVYQITNKVKKIEGVISSDIIAPSTQDNIEQGGLGTVNFNWLMDKPPKTKEEAIRIRDEAMDNPILKGTMVSEDGKALAIYIPIKSKDLSYEVASKIKEYTSKLAGSEEYYISGLPVAEDTFGFQMFKQMAISAPLAMLIIFLLLWFFFRKLSVIISPMIIAMMSVIITMGALIGLGFKVHIMSSMIPIFLMPIAVVDSVHILSEFYDRYQHIRDKKETIIKVMDELFVPMLYTSLTTSVGFVSLALTPIPPVRVFGIFVAIGIMLAWILTITFVPAYTMFIKEESLKDFGADEEGSGGLLGRSLLSLGDFAYKRAKLIIVVTLIIILISGYGITKIVVNDNPVKWFEKDHPIREADRVLNEHFGGTYMAYMVWDTKENKAGLQTTKDDLLAEVRDVKQMYPRLGSNYFNEITNLVNRTFKQYVKRDNYNQIKFINTVKKKIDQIKEESNGDLRWAMDDLAFAVSDMNTEYQTFKQPEVLRYISKVQKQLMATGDVGKVSGLPDVVKKVYKELRQGKEKYYKIPNSAAAVGQTLISFQNSHNPDDLWHFAEPNYRRINLWVQLKKGDNQNMQQVEEKINKWIAEHPPPRNLKFNWAGLTYVNVVWQNKMVMGMLKSLLGSFVIVLVMMTFLFRSVSWGLLSMVPLSVTVALSYGMIGLVGKSYDMPVAVLSSLTLGLSVDFAIHFIQRSRELYEETGSWKETMVKMFGEPARAITRNALVVAIGFLPLLLAPLVPYKTVGILISTILAVSSMATLLILPALITIFKKWFFKEKENEIEKQHYSN